MSLEACEVKRAGCRGLTRATCHVCAGAACAGCSRRVRLEVVGLPRRAQDPESPRVCADCEDVGRGRVGPELKVLS